MKHFAPVVPIKVAEHLKALGVLGTYHLLLAHDVLANRDHYAHVYGHQGMDIIMDNSLIELGHPMGLTAVVEAAHVVGAQQVVLPDVLGDLSKTLEMVHKELREWQKMSPTLTDGIRLVGVVQGKTLDECKHCIAEYHVQGIQLSIPRVLVGLLGTRSEVIAFAVEEFGYDGMHLLGFSDDLIDDVYCARMVGVKGIDSAVPIRAGYKGVALDMLDLNYPENVGKRGDYWERDPSNVAPEEMSLVVRNLDRLRDWINVPIQE